MQDLPFKLVLPWKRRHVPRRLVAVAEDNLVELACLDLAAFDVFKLEAPFCVVGVAGGGLDAGVEDHVVVETEVVGVVLHELLELGLV